MGANVVIISRSAEIVVLATPEKLGAVSAHVIAAANALTSLVTTSPDPLDNFEKLGITVIGP